ncbi:hypothetical protein QGN29_00655 [Temperatibacter marinus]|uniref:DUF1499 domain-containing protein n=1 Tax=Temperatibacter marinus TaxID=1456591 RepID=A0AA52H969_9PROT|nr:hypothetical protein [Temperatibacter marinus]WND02871.1 hypothetical protein QGN29_00655 [Temperatibacter marinus]
MTSNFDKYRNLVLGASLFVMAILVGSLLFLNMSGGDVTGLSREGSLQKTDLAGLNYPADKPGFLACDEQVCPGSVADAPLMAFEAPSKAVRDALVNLIDSNPRLDIRHLDFVDNQYDITVKVKGKTFPDLLTVKIVEVANNPNRTYVAFYSRTIVGSPSSADDMERVLDLRRSITDIVSR